MASLTVGVPAPLPAARVILWLLLAAAAWVPAAPDAGAQTLSLSLGEVRQIQKVREGQQAGDYARLAEASRTYLEKFAQGRYRDEALLARGEALAALERPAEALEVYERLIREFPDSPFREQAMADSIPLLNQTGQSERAAARPEEILNRYPGSLQSDRAQFWQARRKFNEKKYAETLALLSEVSPDRGLSEAERTEYHRVRGWSLMRSGREQDAGVAFARYLEREDATDNRAPVLMLMAEAHRKAGQKETALRFYAEIAELHPHPDFLPKALYRQAEIFEESLAEEGSGSAGEQRLAAAIGHFDAYLETGDKKFLPAALRRRAELLTRAGQTQKALGDFDRLAGLGRKYRGNLTLLKTRAGLLGKVGRPGAAVALLSKAYEDYTLPKRTRSALLVEIAAFHYRADECDRVLERLEPTPVFSETRLRKRAFFMRGFCRYRAGEWEKAALDLETLVEDPEHAELVWSTLLSAYEKSEQHARLARLAEGLLATGKIEPSEDIYLKLGRAYEQKGEPTLMLSAFTRLEALNSDAVNTGEVQFRLGRAEEALGNRDAALTHFRKAATLEDGKTGPPGKFFSQAIEHLQEFLLRRGDFAELAALNDRALTRAQDEAQRERVAEWRTRALIAWAADLGRKGQKGAALEKLEAARGALPAAESSRRLEYLVALAKGFAGQGKYDAAEEMLGEEINQAKDAEFRDQVKQATGRFYLDWAEASEPSDSAKKVIRRYEEALARLPGASWQARYAVALKLDRLYTGESEFARRAAMFAKLTPGISDPELKKSLLRYRSRIYREWGEHEAAAKKPVAALKRFQQGLALLADSDWEGRYDLTTAMGRVYFGRGNLSELLIIYERVLPEVEDAELKGKVRRYVGQIYLEWAKTAQRKGNRKSQRIRAHRALDFLPRSDWERRLAATVVLVAVFEERPAKVAELYADALADLPEGEALQGYSLYLGRLYWEKLKDAAAARKWLKKGDNGGNDPIALESAYLAADVERAEKHPERALKRLEGLVGRGLEQTKWSLLIHYRLAVLYHEKKDFERALRHYRLVAKMKSPGLRKLYPRTIRQAGEQVGEIETYLRFQGGGRSKGVAVPRVRQ